MMFFISLCIYLLNLLFKKTRYFYSRFTFNLLLKPIFILKGKSSPKNVPRRLSGREIYPNINNVFVCLFVLVNSLF